jgi:hypothetical protein
MHFEPICSLRTEGEQTDVTKPIFVSINIAKANNSACTQPSYTNLYQAMAWEQLHFGEKANFLSF